MKKRRHRTEVLEVALIIFEDRVNTESETKEGFFLGLVQKTFKYNFR